MIHYLGANAERVFTVLPKAGLVRFTKPSTQIKGLVVFSAQWCGHCKNLKPVLQRLDQANFGKIPIVVIDIDQDQIMQKVFQKYRLPIQGFPTIYVMDLNGCILPTAYDGPRTLDGLQNLVQQLHPDQLAHQTQRGLY